MRRSQHWLGFALASVLTVPAHASLAQRVAASTWEAAPSLQTRAPTALAAPSHRRAARYVITGALLGGVVGYAYYRNSLDPESEDWFAAVNIPIVVGAGSALGAAIGWVIQRAAAPTSTRGSVRALHWFPPPACLTVPLLWFPFLLHANPTEQVAWRLIGRGEGVHRKEVGEDICIDGLDAVRGSVESRNSLKRWFVARGASSHAQQQTVEPMEIRCARFVAFRRRST